MGPPKEEPFNAKARRGKDRKEFKGEPFNAKAQRRKDRKGFKDRLNLGLFSRPKRLL
jgi:hypothetical protein